MDQATDHDTLIRAQAARRVLRFIAGGDFEHTALARHQTTFTTAQDYMAKDAYGDEEPQQ